MSIEDIPVDEVKLIFREGYASGRYLIRIERGETSVESLPGESPEEIAGRLIDYHGNCVLHMYSQVTRKPSVYEGAGSENGTWRYPWMAKWRFNSEGVQLTNVQEKLFNGIVDMRNTFVGLLESPDVYGKLTNSEKE